MMSLGLWLFGPTSLQLLGLGYESSILQDFQLPQPPGPPLGFQQGNPQSFSYLLPSEHPQLLACPPTMLPRSLGHTGSSS